MGYFDSSDETILASWQQPANFFCKEAPPGQHRLEAPCFCGIESALSFVREVHFMSMWKDLLRRPIRPGANPARFSGIASLFTVAVLMGATAPASGLGDHDSEGQNLDRTHADGTRWLSPELKLDLPIMALLWFAGETEALEFSVGRDDWGTAKTTRLLEKTTRAQRLTTETISSISNLLGRLPQHSYVPNAPDTDVSLTELVRVSWQDGANWVSRTYSRKSPPEELLQLFHLLDLRFEFICNRLPQSAPAAVKDLPGSSSGFASATCDLGLLLVSNGKVILLDASQSREPKYLPAPADLTNAQSFGVTPDATRMVFLTEKSMTLHDVRSGKELWRQPLARNLYRKTATPDPGGSRIAVWNDKNLFLYDTTGGAERRLVTESRDSISDVAWSRDGRWIAIASDAYVKLWDPLNDKIFVLSTNRWARCIAFSPDAKQLAIASQTEVKIEVFDTAERKLAFTIPSLVEIRGMPYYIPKRMAWSSAGTFLALELDPYGCLLFDTQKHVPIAYDLSTIRSPVAFDKKGTSMIAVTMHRDILRWKWQDSGP